MLRLLRTSTRKGIKNTLSTERREKQPHVGEADKPLQTTLCLLMSRRSKKTKVQRCNTSHRQMLSPHTHNVFPLLCYMTTSDRLSTKKKKRNTHKIKKSRNKAFSLRFEAKKNPVSFHLNCLYSKKLWIKDRDGLCKRSARELYSETS